MGSLYTPSSFLTLLKQDIGIKNIPLPVDDEDLYDHFKESALKEFSIRHPRIKTFRFNENERVNESIDNVNTTPHIYRIPKSVYLDSTIIGVYKVDTAKPMGYSDLYVPQGMYASPDSIMEAIGDIRVAASVAASMGKAPTFQWVSPDFIYMYNGWSSGVYEAVIGVTHDPSLVTIQPTQFSSLRKLAALDLKAYLYGKLMRNDELDVGIGTISLKIEKWSDADEKMQDLLEKWDEDSNLETDYIQWF